MASRGARAAARRGADGLLSGAQRDDRMLGTIRQGLKEAGYVEGRSVAIKYRTADGRFNRLPGLAAELVADPVAVIVALATQAISPRRDEFAQVLVVFAGLIRATTSQSSRQNVLDVDANAVPAQRVRRVDRGDGQLDQADDRQDGDGEPSVSARGARPAAAPRCGNNRPSSPPAGN